MTEQAHPDYNADMERQRTATRVAERRIKEQEVVIVQLRALLDAGEIAKREAARDLNAARATIAALERRLAEAQQGLTVAEGG